MKYQCVIWGLMSHERALDALKIAADFGIAIVWYKHCAWTKPNGTLIQWVNVGLIIPEEIEFKEFNRRLCDISTRHDDGGIVTYDIVFGPLGGGNGGKVELKDCLYVPENFMNPKAIAQERHARVINFVSDYLDKMPPHCKVTYRELVPYVCQQCSWSSPPAVSAIVHEIVQARQDLTVERGRGICKRG